MRWLQFVMVVVPETVRSLFGWPVQDPIVYGVTGSVWLAFGFLSILGEFPNYAILHVVVMGSYIIGDLVVIPFSYVFSKKVFADTALTMEKI